MVAPCLNSFLYGIILLLLLLFDFQNAVAFPPGEKGTRTTARADRLLILRDGRRHAGRVWTRSRAE